MPFTQEKRNPKGWVASRTQQNGTKHLVLQYLAQRFPGFGQFALALLDLLRIAITQGLLQIGFTFADFLTRFVDLFLPFGL